MRPSPPALSPLIWYAVVPCWVCVDPRPLRPAGPPVQLCGAGAVFWGWRGLTSGPPHPPHPPPGQFAMR